MMSVLVHVGGVVEVLLVGGSKERENGGGLVGEGAKGVKVELS